VSPDLFSFFPALKAEARRTARAKPELMAKLQELISSTTGIPALPSEEVIQEIIQEAQRALYEDQWQNLCSLRRREALCPTSW
jgi:hypothetical protein